MYIKKDIQGFPNYQVDTDGSIWSVWRRGVGVREANGRIVKAIATAGGRGKKICVVAGKDGYLQVNLINPVKKRVTKMVHRLVLEVFRGECREGHEACHNNGDRTDNRLENLRWDTHRNNILDKKLHCVN